MKDFAINTVIRYSDGTRIKVVEHECSCEHCCFGRYSETRVMGVPRNQMYYCGLSTLTETFCNAKSRKDGKNVVYKLIK